jgi:dihydroflavonol-4-reductase
VTFVQPSANPSRCLVTGGSGFIGRHLVSALVARGHCVRVYDCSQPVGWSPGVEYVRGSILDRAGVMRALDGIDCVYHLAAIAHLWRPQADDFDTVNRGGTEIVLAAAADRRIRRFIHCSTETVLLPPRRGTGTVDETMSPRLADMAGPYTRSKYLAERAALSAAARGLPVVIVNPTLPIGSGDRDFTPPTAMLALYLLTSSPFFLDCLLNLVDVRDVAIGMILAAERGCVGERYILGGENIRLRELASGLGHLAGRGARKLNVPAPVALAAGFLGEWISNTFTHRSPIATAEGVRLALRSAPFDNGKARRELGYAPRPVQQALTDAAAWIFATIAAEAATKPGRGSATLALGRRQSAHLAALRVNK